MGWSGWRQILQRLFGKEEAREPSIRVRPEANWRPARNYDDWHHAQFPGVGEGADKRELIIGLDFGTSYSKVVIGETRIHYAVPFFLNGHMPRYLFPTVLMISPDDKGTVSFSGDGSENELQRIDRLKIRLLDNDTSEESLVHNAAYLALLLRHARGWLMECHASIYGSYYLDWLINIGLPTDTFFDSEIGTVYRQLVRAAWLASIQDGPVTLEGARAALAAVAPSADARADPSNPYELDPDQIWTFPELVAEVAGYLRSPMRQDDLHVLVDIGAGTLDVAVFNVYLTTDEEDLLPIFEKSVTPQGTAYLMECRRQALGDGRALLWRHQDKVPDAAELAHRAGVAVSVLKNADASFASEVRKSILAPVRTTRMSRYPTSRRWEEGIPLIVCGGGANCAPYLEMFEELLAIGESFPLRRLRHPRPEDLEAPGTEAQLLDRLNVAYGLSFSPLDLAQVRGPREIEDYTRESTAGRYKDRYIDKDQV